MHAAPKGGSACLSKAGSLLAGPCGAPEVQRLKTRAQFEAVMAGTTVSRTPHFALHRMPLDAPRDSITGSGAVSQTLFAVRDAWVGALVPKRWAKRAVTRNAIKRQIYAVSQAALPPLPV